jgi:anti-sigma factor RsiW
MRARLNDYLERDLPPRERSRVAAHLAECPDCAEELRELESTVELLRRLPEAEVPPAFAMSVMARVRAGEAEPRGVVRWLRALAAPALAVPLAAGLAGLVFFAGLWDGSFEQPGVRIAVREPAPAPAPGPARIASRSPIRPAAGPEASAAQAGPSFHLAQAMQRHSMLLELAKRGRTKEVALTLRGAGHPLSSSMASHLEEDEPVNVAFASWAPGQ